MNFKSVMAAMLGAALLFTLSACAKAPAQTEPSVLPTEQTHACGGSAVAEKFCR